MRLAFAREVCVRRKRTYLRIASQGPTMRRTLLALALATSPLFCDAQAPAALGKCIVENLSHQDRADLARWVFLSMAVHPGVAQLSNAPAESREQAHRAIGDLFTRLMTEACSKELREAGRAGGRPVIPAAIQFLTQIGV
jgi:hypothetical protein